VVCHDLADPRRDDDGKVAAITAPTVIDRPSNCCHGLQEGNGISSIFQGLLSLLCILHELAKVAIASLRGASLRSQ
jgi:hypothetical protein